jgi:hypothetical protein
MQESELKQLQGVSILTKEFFNKLIRRIECTKPIAGTGVTIEKKEDGFVINTAPLARTAQINVCSGGVSTTIKVYIAD